MFMALQEKNIKDKKRTKKMLRKNENGHWEGLVCYDFDIAGGDGVAEVYIWNTADGYHPEKGECFHYYDEDGKPDESCEDNIGELSPGDEEYEECYSDMEPCYYAMCDGGDNYEIDELETND
jgi:hypothetical protein